MEGSCFAPAPCFFFVIVSNFLESNSGQEHFKNVLLFNSAYFEHRLNFSMLFWCVKKKPGHGHWCTPMQTLPFVPAGDNSLDDLFSLWHGEPDVRFPENNLKRERVWPQNRTWNHTCLDCLMDVTWAWAQRTLVDCVVTSNNSFLNYFQAHVGNFITAGWRFFTQCYMRAQRSCTFSSGFRPRPLCAKIFLDLFTILSTVDG